MTFDHESLAILGEMPASLEQGFSGLPRLPPQIDRARSARCCWKRRSGLQGQLPVSSPALYRPDAQAAAPGRPGWPMRWRCSSTRTTTLSTAAEPPRRWRRSRWPGSRGCSAGRTHLGHLCGGGTMANFEALWVGRELRPGRAVAASAQAHYTHSRLSAVLGVPFRKIPVDRPRTDGCPRPWKKRSAEGEIGTVVVTLGTTAAGTVDPLPEVLALRERHDFRIHVNAAYGGYFTLAGNLGPETRAAFDRHW